MTGPDTPPARPAALPGEPGGKPYRRLSPLTPLARGGVLLVAAVGATWQQLISGRELGVAGLALLVLLVGGGVYGFASWVRTKYWIDEAELRVDTGVLSRQSRRIRIDRLQGIDIVQPVVPRLLGLAELRLDVAGGGSREGSLAYLRLAEAHDLKQVLLARRDAARVAAASGVAGATGGSGPGAGPRSAGAGSVGAGVATPGSPGRSADLAASGRVWGAEPPSGPAAGPVAPPRPDRVLARLDLRLLVASLLLSWESVGVVAGAAVLLVLSLSGAVVVGVTGAVPVLVGYVVVAVRRLNGFYGFTVSDTEAGLHVDRGLLALTSQTVALHRIQGVVVSEPLLWRWMGWARVDVSVAGYHSGDAEQRESESTILPVGPRAEAFALASYALRGLQVERVPLVAAPQEAGWAAPVASSFLAAGIDEHLVVSRSGVLSRRTHAVPHARVQSLRLRQGPWQRVLGLGDVYVDSPPGPVRVQARHRRAAEARWLLDRATLLAREARR